MNAILPLGAVFGTPLAAWIPDRYGRRMAMLVGDVIMIISSIIQTVSINSKCPLRPPKFAMFTIDSNNPKLLCIWHRGFSLALGLLLPRAPRR